MNLSEGPFIGGSVASRKRWLPVLFFITAACAACLAALVGLEYAPRYLTLSIRVPPDDYASGLWDTTSYSVESQLWGFGRLFIWRRDADVIYVNAGESDKLPSIRGYFLNELTHRGWISTEDTELCGRHMLEATLLMEQQQGEVLQFGEKNHPFYSTGQYFGDLVCVSILQVHKNTSGQDQAFHITLVTVRQSPLRILLNYLAALSS